MRKNGKRFRAQRRVVDGWRRRDVNHRTDEERWTNEHYFRDLSPVHWLSRQAIEEAKANFIDPDEAGDVPDQATFIEPLREDAFWDLDRMRATRGTYLAAARRDYDRYLTRAERHWRTALDCFDIYVWNSIEAQAALDRRLEAWGAEDHLSQVMTRTSGRGMLIAREIGWLLRGGYPQAGRARWRTLHEVAVQVTYLRVYGDEAAERIYAHELLQAVQVNHEKREADGSPEALGEEYEWEQDLMREMLTRYGADFANRYGWAADVVGAARPTFKQIEQAAGLANWRRAYEDATYAAHATSRPVHEESFRRAGRDIFAPTHDGLATPAIMTIRSLLQVSCATLGIFVKSIEEIGGDLKTALLLDAVAREAIDAWASHEWPFWGLKHIPG